MINFVHWWWSGRCTDVLSF